MDGQPCYMQLLVPAWGALQNELASSRGLLVSNKGSQMFYAPFGFPILGEYADYGDIDGIVRDQNVEMLEAYFGKDIDSILQIATQGGDQPAPTYDELEQLRGNKYGGILTAEQVLPILTATYFRKEVHDYLVEQKQDSWFSKHLKTMLAGLPEQLNKTEYGYIDPDEDLDAMQALQEDTDQIKQMLKAMKALGSRRESSYIDSLTSVDMFVTLPITKVFSAEVEAQYKLLTALTMLRKHLLPSIYGSQQDNYRETLGLQVFVNKLLRADIKEQKSW